MPHAILRALRHRSTPTLLPSTSPQPPQHQDGFLIIPSIFITLPEEEGAHHWCALAGTAAPVNGGGSPSFDVPLPDFAALEETIDRLKRAGETPTFRRPGRKDEVVLPKRKYINQSVQHYNHHHQHVMHSHSSNGAGPGVGTKRPRPKRPQTSPITRQERALVKASHESIVASPVSDKSHAVEMNASGRFTPTKVFRGLGRSKRQNPRPSLVLTSISYESVAAQPLSAPAQYDSLPTRRAGTPAQGSGSLRDNASKRKRSSLGWLFSSKRVSVPVMREHVEALDMVTEREDDHAQQPWASQYTMPACFEDDQFEEPPHLHAETHESDLDKPLPPIPAALAQTFPPDAPVMAAEISSPTASSEASAPEMQINDSVRVQVVMAMNDAFREDVDFSLTQPRTPPANELASNIPASTTPVVTVEKEKKIKRKFSLKRLRERFLSSATPTSARDMPPVPDLPPAIMVLPIIGPIDPPFTPPSLPIDPPFTPPSLPNFVLSPAPPATKSARSEEHIANAKTIETTRSGSPSPPPLDEDSNHSTSSEDSAGSSAAVSNNTSSPDSTPPHTPDSVRVDPIFGLLQGPDEEHKSEAKRALDGSELKIKVAAVDTGITRSTGMRRQLDSLRFNETHTGTATV